MTKKIISTCENLYEFDRIGVRPFVRYSLGNGTWSIECYRKKLPHESKGDCDWKMIREGHVQTYNTRKEAIEKVLIMADEICEKYGYYLINNQILKNHE